MPVGSYPSGATVWGVQDMVGNVWEFIDERIAPSDEAVEKFQGARLKYKLTPLPTKEEAWYPIMGGSYENTLPLGATYDSASVPGRLQSPIIGFRCVKDAK